MKRKDIFHFFLLCLVFSKHMNTFTARASFRLSNLRRANADDMMALSLEPWNTLGFTSVEAAIQHMLSRAVYRVTPTSHQPYKTTKIVRHEPGLRSLLLSSHGGLHTCQWSADFYYIYILTQKTWMKWGNTIFLHMATRGFAAREAVFCFCFFKQNE